MSVKKVMCDRVYRERMKYHMLKKFSVKNYKNFKDEICIDFCDIAGYQFSTDCISDGMISKMLIYGRNATGKTNLGRALTDIIYILYSGLSIKEHFLMPIRQRRHRFLFTHSNLMVTR